MSELGGGIQGISVRQTANSMRSSDSVMARKVLRGSWNNQLVGATLLDRQRAIGPFRAVNNLGDYLNRQNYSCGGPNQVNKDKPGMVIGAVPQKCDGSGIQAASCNPKFVPDSSDYIKYRKLRAMSQTYNDNKFGGDQSNGSYVHLMAVRR